MGRALAPPAKNPTPAFGHSGLVSTGIRGLTHYRVGNPTNDKFQMYADTKFAFIPVSENGQNGLGEEGADGKCPQNFCARSAHDYKIGLSILQFIRVNWVNQRHAVYALYFIVKYSVYSRVQGLISCVCVLRVCVCVFVLHFSKRLAYHSDIVSVSPAVWLVSYQLTRNCVPYVNVAYVLKHSKTLEFCRVSTRSVSSVC